MKLLPPHYSTLPNQLKTAISKARHSHKLVPKFENIFSGISLSNRPKVVVFTAEPVSPDKRLVSEGVIYLSWIMTGELTNRGFRWHYGIGWEGVTEQFLKDVDKEYSSLVYILVGEVPASIYHRCFSSSLKNLVIECPDLSCLTADDYDDINDWLRRKFDTELDLTDV